MRVVKLAALAGAVASVAAVPGTIGTAAAQPSSAKATTVAVSLMEWMVMASPTRASAGTVMFKVRNKGKLRHNLVVIKTRRPSAMLPMKGTSVIERNRVAKSRLLAPGSSQMLMVKLAKGSYVLICNVPGHYMAGMKRILRVT